MNTRSIAALAASRDSLIVAMSAGGIPDATMDNLVEHVARIEWQIIEAPTFTVAELVIKTRMLLEKLTDAAGYDELIDELVAHLPQNLQSIKQEIAREEERALRGAYRQAA